MRVLLHAFPFYEMHKNDDRRLERLRHYDALPLAIRAFDLIIENTGLEDVDAERVRSELDRLMSAMDQKAGLRPDGRSHADMADLVVGFLRNDPDRRRPFDIPYVDFDESGAPAERHLTFRLVVEEFHSSGRIVLRPTTEGLNLYLNALDQDIESAQAAAEAMLENQLRRGKIEDAARSAQTARLQSLRYRQKIERVLQDTKRDVNRVDWEHDVPAMLNESVIHIDSRQKVEQVIISAAQQKLDDLPIDDKHTPVLTGILNTMRECQHRHAELHGHVIGARDTFLREQERQAFAPRPFRFQPNLLDDTLRPLLSMTVQKADAALTPTAPTFLGARPEPVFSLVQLVNWQLQGERETGGGMVPVDALDLAAMNADFPAYTVEQHAQVERILANIRAPAQLSDVLAAARAADVPNAVCELLALVVLRNFAPETRGTLIVTRAMGATLRDVHLYGDELTIAPGGNG